MTYLIIMIERKKRELKELVEKHGMTSEQSIKCSQELDTLLNLLLSSTEKK